MITFLLRDSNKINTTIRDKAFEVCSLKMSDSYYNRKFSKQSFKSLNLKFILSVILIIFGSALYGQTQTFIDSRDSSEYTLVTIGNRVWFQENLKLETDQSHCPNFNRRKGDCKKGNYYSYKELAHLCPKNWRIANLSDWEAYIDALIDKDLGEQHKNILQVDTLSFWGDLKHEVDTTHLTKAIPYATVDIQINSPHFDLFKSDNPLHLENVRWVEGRKVRKKSGSFTLWINHENLSDARYHVHIGSNNYVKHIHKHNIDDTPSKTRKFAVRCVCDVK